MKSIFSVLVFSIIFASHSAQAASSSSSSTQSLQELNFVGGVRISPFFCAIPDLHEPTKYMRPFSGTYAEDFESYKQHLQAHRAEVRSSMEDGIVPVHALIRRLARRNITIAFKSPDSLELLEDPAHLCDKSIDSSFCGVSIKDSLAIHEQGDHIKYRIPYEQCNELLGADCIDYLKEVKTSGTALWHALHGENTPVKLGYYLDLQGAPVGTSRKDGSCRLFVRSIRRGQAVSREIEAGVIDRSEVRARQHAALLSIMRMCGEPVVKMCKEKIVEEWLAEYRKENPHILQNANAELYPSMPILSYSIPADSCEIL